MKLKVVFFEMENNREKSLARLIKKKIENTQIDTFICIIKWKRRCYKWYYRNKTDYTIICQQIGQSRRNG